MTERGNIILILLIHMGEGSLSLEVDFELLCREVFAPSVLSHLKGELLLRTQVKKILHESFATGLKAVSSKFLKMNIKSLKPKLLDEYEIKQSIDLHEHSE